MNDIKFIRDRVPPDALYDQMGEEMAELAQAIFKLRRAEGNSNPTPVTVEEARAAVQEEITDVVNVAQVLGIRIEPEKTESADYNERVAIFAIGTTLTNIAMRRTGLAWKINELMGSVKAMGYEITGSEEKLRRWRERLEEKR